MNDSMAKPPTMNSKLRLESPFVGDKWKRHSSPIIHEPDSSTTIHLLSDAEEDRYDVDSLEYQAKIVASPRVDVANTATTKDLVEQIEHKVSSMTSIQAPGSATESDSVQNFDDLNSKE